MHDPEAMIHDLSASSWELDPEAEDRSPADAISQAKPKPRDNRAQAAAKREIAADLAKMGTTVDAWFGDIDTHATFLGKPIGPSSGAVPGVHSVFTRRLARVEQRLMKELGASSPAECARKLRLYEMKGLRAPKLATGGSRVSMHCFGLAIDVNYAGNPFLQPRSVSPEVIKRATQLVTGTPVNVLSNPFPRDAGKTWDWLHAASEAFKVYFQLRRPQNLQRLIDRARASGGGRDAAAWQAQIAADYQLLDHRSSFVHRDPAKGFLDLDRRLVVAMVETGGLLWGGMYAPRTGKDLMHFDWRGPRNARNDPKSWLQVGGSDAEVDDAGWANHEYGPPDSPFLELAHEAPVARAPAPDSPGRTIYPSIPLGKDCVWRRGKDRKFTCVDTITLPARTGIYLPDRFHDEEGIDLIVYLHGHLVPVCGNQRTDQVDRYWQRPKFPLREGLQRTGRNFALVVPSLGPQSQSGLLRRPGGFDKYMKQVLTAIAPPPGSGSTRPLDIGRIILAAHSGGGSTMRAIATSGDSYARRIRECWGFDCLYGGSDDAVWARWARAHRNSRLYIHYRAGEATAGNSESLRDKHLPNVFVRPAPERHCDVPMTYWQRRILAALRTTTTPAAPTTEW